MPSSWSPAAGPRPLFLAGRQAPGPRRRAAPGRRRAEAGDARDQIASGLQRLSRDDTADRGQSAAEAAEAAGIAPWGTVFSAIQDFYNGTVGKPRDVTRAAKDIYDFERGGLKWALQSLDESTVARLRHRGAALVRLLGKSKAAGGLRDALLAQSAVLSTFADKASSLASSPADFISGLSEVFRSVEDVEEAARLAVINGTIDEKGEEGKATTDASVGSSAPALEEEHPLGPYGLVVHDSAARRCATGNWVVPIQAWVYRRNEARHKIRMALCRKLLVEMYHGISNIGEEAKRRYEERGRLIFRTLAFRGGERNSELEVQFDGEEVWRPLPPTGGNGRVKTELTVKAELAQRAAKGSDGRPSLGFRVRIANKKGKGLNVTERARALLTEPTGVLVVSDIDDTVKVTEVFLGKEMIVRNTFLEEFRAVEGMAPLYRAWAQDVGADFAFVSNSPPEFQELLRDFLQDAGFPTAPIHLRPLGGTKEERRSFKQQKIEELLAQFPLRKVVLVGDSGERDPVMSAALLRKFPEQVVKALIRQVHPDMPVDPAVFEGLPPERWQVFSDPQVATLPDDLGDGSVPDFWLPQGFDPGAAANEGRERVLRALKAKAR